MACSARSLNAGNHRWTAGFCANTTPVAGYHRRESGHQSARSLFSDDNSGVAFRSLDGRPRNAVGGGRVPYLGHRDRAIAKELVEQLDGLQFLALFLGVFEQFEWAAFEPVAPDNALRRKIVIGQHILPQQVFEAAAIGADVGRDSTNRRGPSSLSPLAAAKTTRGMAPKASDPVMRSIGSRPCVPLVKCVMPSVMKLRSTPRSTSGCKPRRVSEFL